MGIEDGKIVLNNDNGVYYAGQTVSGKLIFKEKKERSFRGIYVKLKGFCHVHWCQKYGKTVKYESREEYVNQKTYVIGSENGQLTIPAGHYEYSFFFVIPSNCPSSFEGMYGNVQYCVKAVMDHANKFNLEKKAIIQVIAPLDLNLLPGIREPVNIKFDETYYYCCVRSKSLDAVVKLPCTGFVPGQSIPIEVITDNTSSVTVKSIILTIIKDITYHGESDLSEDTRSETQSLELPLCKLTENSSGSFTTSLLVPQMNTGNLRNCHYIDVNYTLQVLLISDKFHSKSPQFQNIVLGTIPLIGFDYTLIEENQESLHNVPVVNQSLVSHPPRLTSSNTSGVTPHRGSDLFPSDSPYSGPMVALHGNPNYINGNNYPHYPRPYTTSPGVCDFNPQADNKATIPQSQYGAFAYPMYPPNQFPAASAPQLS